MVQMRFPHLAGIIYCNFDGETASCLLCGTTSNIINGRSHRSHKDFTDTRTLFSLWGAVPLRHARELRFFCIFTPPCTQESQLQSHPYRSFSPTRPCPSGRPPHGARCRRPGRRAAGPSGAPPSSRPSRAPRAPAPTAGRVGTARTTTMTWNGSGRRNK